MASVSEAAMAVRVEPLGRFRQGRNSQWWVRFDRKKSMHTGRGNCPDGKL
jgi:hypothetical protein